MCAIFYQIFIFHQTEALQKLWTCYLFHLENSFCYRDIQIFVFPSWSLSPAVSDCFRDWSKISFKVYDIINCPNKNLKLSFVWYLGKEKRYDIKMLGIDWVLNNEHFMGKSCIKFTAKSSPRFLFNFDK